MNILFIDLHCDATMPSGANEFGGGNTYSRGLLKGITQNENLFCVYITRKKFKNMLSSEQISENCFIERIVLGDSIDDKDTLQDYADDAFKEIKAIINKYKLKDFIIHSSYWHSGLIAMQLAKEYNTYYIHTIQSNGKKKAIVNSKQHNLNERIMAEKAIFTNAKYLICSSKSEQEEIHRLYDIEFSKLILTGLPIATEFSKPTHNKYGCVSTYSITNKSVSSFIPSGYNLETFDEWWVNGPFIYYGRLHIDKGIPEIIEAWHILYEKYGAQTPPLWVVGGVPSQIAAIRKLLIEKGIYIDKYENRQKLVWWGTLSPSELSCLLTKSMVLVTHSKYESGGLMIIESLACSTPVIASSFGYANDYIRNWYNGFLVDYGNISLLAMRMSLFIENPYLSDMLSKNAKLTYEQISNDFDFLKIHFDLYNDEIKQNSPIVIEDTLELNLSLGYQNIPSEQTIDSILKNFLKSSSYTITKTFTSKHSITKFIKSNNKEYRVDIWLTTLNMEKFLQKDAPYLITSTDKIKSIIELQNLNSFNTLAYYSIENKISIIELKTDFKKLNISDMLELVDDVFYCEVNEVKDEVTLAEKITNLFYNTDEYKAYIGDTDNIKQILNVLIKLKEYNSKRLKLNDGLTVYIDSLDNMYNNRLYGTFKYSLSEYGHNIAIIFLLMQTEPNKNNLYNFDSSERESIIAWYVYLKLESIFYQMIQFPNLEYENNIKQLIDFLE